MKKFTQTMVAVALLSFSAQAMAWTRIATCGTGDALEGMDVYTDGENIIAQVLTYKETPNGEGATVVNEYRTNNGDVNPVAIDAVDVMNKLANGDALSFVVTKEDSFSFGGVVTNAALLNLKLNPANSGDSQHFDYTSMLAFEGSVAHFFCY